MGKGEVGALGQGMLLVTDYTSCESLCIPLDTQPPPHLPQEILLTLTLWDEHAARVHGIALDEFYLFRNVHPRLHSSGRLDYLFMETE